MMRNRGSALGMHHQMKDEEFEVRAVARVESPLVDRKVAPKQGDEGAPEAWLIFDERYRDALRDLRPGMEVFVLTWLHRSRRDVLVVHPRDDLSNPEQGVFSTRSSERPNPIGLHRVQIRTIDDCRVCVNNFEAIDGTPVIDVKPVLDRDGERR
jgi:tRNA-Thr(GGU) m(6)t(6)A37 methyltransferase TsaA